MRQILQSFRRGMTHGMGNPGPPLRANYLVMQTRVSLLAAGAERRVTIGGGAWQAPETDRIVLERAPVDGLQATIASVLGQLETPKERMCCNVGTVLEVGPGVTEFAAGDRVLSLGERTDIACVPKNLCAKIPGGVCDEFATFGAPGALALEGIRLAQPTLGDCFLVFGLGLVGLLAVQLLQAQGVRVLAADFDPARLALATQLGAKTADLRHHELIARGFEFSRGSGVDGVLLSSATNRELMLQVTETSRKRARIVQIGVTGRPSFDDIFSPKELSFQVSHSRGPGSGDFAYEREGIDYPLAFVRWTEQRNVEAVMELLATEKLNVAPLITHRFPLADADAAEEVFSGQESALGILLQMPVSEPRGKRAGLHQGDAPKLKAGARSPASSPLVVALAGNYGFESSKSLSSFRAAGCRCQLVAYKGRDREDDLGRILADRDIDVMLIASQGGDSAELTCRTLASGKHVFLEQPPAWNTDQVATVAAAYHAAQGAFPAPHLMVGYHRRFAPQIQTIAGLLRGIAEPKSFVMTVHGNRLSAALNSDICHFLDLLRFLCGQQVIEVQALVTGNQRIAAVREEITCTLKFADGSFGTIHSFLNGQQHFPQERLEIFCGGRILQLENFRKLRGYGWPNFRGENLWRPNTGQQAAVAAFCEAVRTGDEVPMPFEQFQEATRLLVAVMNAAESGEIVYLAESIAEETAAKDGKNALTFVDQTEMTASRRSS